MSDTDSTSSRPGSGSGSAVSTGPSDDQTQPLTTGGAGSTDAVVAQGGEDKPATTAIKTATPVPAESRSDQKAVATKPAATPAPARRPAAAAGRRVRLTVSRIDPWSAMKMSFLLSVAIGIAMVVMTFVLWSVLAGMGVFDKVNELAAALFPVDSGEQAFDLMNYIGLAKVMSLAIVVGVIDVILITAIATLGAFLYNVSAALVGGLQLTLTDD